MGALFVSFSLAKAQLIDVPDSPSTSRVVIHPVVLDNQGLSSLDAYILSIWQTWWGELSPFEDAYLVESKYVHGSFEYSLSLNQMDLVSRSEHDIQLPIGIPLMSLYSVSNPTLEFETVTAVDEDFYVYKREIPQATGTTELLVEGDWKRGVVFPAQTTRADNKSHEFMIMPRNQKGALGGKSGQLHAGVNPLMISLGFLPNGESAGYLSILEDWNSQLSPDINHNFYLNPHYFPATSARLSSISSEVSAEYVVVNNHSQSGSDVLAIKRVIAPQVVVEIGHTDWYGNGLTYSNDPVYRSYRTEGIEWIKVKDRETNALIVEYRFYSHTELSHDFGNPEPDFVPTFEYIVIRRIEGEDDRYALIIRQNNQFFSVSPSAIERIETPFIKIDPLAVSPPAVSPFPLSTEYQDFFRQFVDVYQQGGEKAVLKSSLFPYTPWTQSWNHGIFPVDMGNNWTDPEIFPWYGGFGADAINLTSVSRMFNIPTALQNETDQYNYYLSSVGVGYNSPLGRITMEASLNGFVAGDDLVPDEDITFLESVLSYSVHDYHGAAFNLAHPLASSGLYGTSSVARETFTVGRPGHYRRVERGVNNLETAYSTTAKYELMPGNDGFYRHMSLNYYTFDQLVEDVWDSALDPMKLFESPPKSLRHYVVDALPEGVITESRLVGKSEFAKPDFQLTAGLYSQPIVVRETETFRRSDQSLTTVTKHFHPHADMKWLRDLPYSVENPDGTKTVYLYELGVWDSSQNTFTPDTLDGEDLRITTLSGLNPVGSGGVSNWNGLSGHEPIELVAGKSTIDVTYRSRYGFTSRMENYLFIGGAGNTTNAQVLTGFQSMEYNRAGHLVRREDDKGNLYLAEYSSGGTRYSNDGNSRRGQKIWEQMEDGSEFHYTYDNLGRVHSRTRLSKSGGGHSLTAIGTIFAYDSDNRVIREETGAVAAGFNGNDPDSVPVLIDPQVTVLKYNALGEVVRREENGYETIIDIAGINLTEVYWDLEDRNISQVDVQNSLELVTTETLPTGANRITTLYKDGSVASVTGSAVVPTYYEYGLDEEPGGDLLETVTIFHGSDGRASTMPVKFAANSHRAGNYRYSKVVKDWIGNTVRQIHSSGIDSGSDESRTVFGYNDKGQLHWQRENAKAANYFEYDSFGQLKLAGFDLGESGGLTATVDPQGIVAPDRINETESQLELHNNNWWRVVRKYVHDLDAEGGANLVLVQIEREQVTDLGGTGADGRLVSVMEIEDANAQVIRSETWHDSGSGISTVKEFSPFHSNPSVSIYLLGKRVRSASPSGVAVDYQYDTQNRLWKVIDPKFGETIYEYYPQTHKLFRIKSNRLVNDEFGEEVGDSEMTDIRTFYYDNGGRLIRESNAAGKNTRYAYNERNQLTHIWGEVPYPVKYIYYEEGPRTGQLKEKITYSNESPIGGWNQVSSATIDQWWPSGGNRTVYDYYLRSGLLKRVEYHNHTGSPATVHATEYTYNLDGALATRSWQRNYNGQKVTTTYTYDPATGELTDVDYNDGTPSLSYGYSRTGSLQSVSDVVGTRTFKYRSTDLKLERELWPAGLYGSSAEFLEYQYEHSTGRYAGKNFGGNNFSYEFDPANGRLSVITGPSGSFTYGYSPHSDLIGSISQPGNDDQDWERKITYNAHHPVIEKVENRVGNRNIASYEYGLDNLLRRSFAVQTGEVFQPYGYGLLHEMTYNNRNELTNFSTIRLTGAQTVGVTIPDRSQNFSFDDIGNRKTAQVSGQSQQQYSVNALNQYESLSHGGGGYIRGFVAPGAALDVDASPDNLDVNQQGGRYGNYFVWNIGKSGLSSPQAWDFTLEGILDGAKKAEHSLTKVLPPALELFEYDDDGNMTRDAQWEYEYDGENRLKEATSRQAFYGAEKNRYVRFHYRYDYMGRRVEKVSESAAAGSPGNWQLDEVRRFAYDGWALLGEYVDTEPVSVLGAEVTLERSYTWGPDLSQTIGGAGGIGGLLGITESENNHSYLAGYDGNGNVTALIQRGSGTIEAGYEYSAFGEIDRQTGAYAQRNPIRFSSKYYDKDTRLSFFGFRYYSASLGRFINRDPLEERGAWNLYRNLSYTTTNPYFGGSRLGGTSWFDRWQQSQDALLRNASFSHSTEEVQLGGIRNSGFMGAHESYKKFYSANAGVTVGQGGSKGLEFDNPDIGTMTYSGMASPGYLNKDTNLYAFVGNGPINLYDPLGLRLSSVELNEEEERERARALARQNASVSGAVLFVPNEAQSGEQSWFGRSWDTIKTIGSGLQEGMLNIRDSVTFTHGPKVGIGVQTKAFGGRASLFNLSGGYSITTRGDGSSEWVFNYNADLLKLSYENVDAGVGWGTQFGIGADSSGQQFMIDETRSAFGLPSYNLNSGNYSVNHSEVSARVTFFVYEVGAGFDWKVMFGVGGGGD